MTEPHYTPAQRSLMIAWMAERFVERAGEPLSEATEYATQVLDGYSPEDLEGHECDRDTAHELADTDMSYWEG